MAKLLYFFPGPYTMLSAYIDESGSHEDSEVMCVAGLLYDHEKFAEVDLVWKEALEKAGISCFHAMDAQHRKEEFKGWNSSEVERFRLELVRSTKKCICGGAIAFITSKKKFNEFKKDKSWKYSQYTTCAYACMYMLQNIAAQQGESHVHYTIEGGHKNMGELNGFIEKLQMAGIPGMYDFGDKTLRPLQTADLWAYEARRRVDGAQDDATLRPVTVVLLTPAEKKTPSLVNVRIIKHET